MTINRRAMLAQSAAAASFIPSLSVAARAAPAPQETELLRLGRRFDACKVRLDAAIARDTSGITPDITAWIRRTDVAARDVLGARAITRADVEVKAYAAGYLVFDFVEDDALALFQSLFADLRAVHPWW